MYVGGVNIQFHESAKEAAKEEQITGLEPATLASAINSRRGV